MEKLIRIEQYLDADGKITRLPRKPAQKRALLAYLAARFAPDRLYTEPEVNAICEANHTFHDYFLLRRELVEFGFLCRMRDGSRYWKTPPPANGAGQNPTAAEAETVSAPEEAPAARAVDREA